MKTIIKISFVIGTISTVCMFFIGLVKGFILITILASIFTFVLSIIYKKLFNNNPKTNHELVYDKERDGIIND